MPRLEDYVPFVDPGTIEGLRLLGEKLEGKRIQNINSTAVGGGVAEILSRMMPLMKELGVQARWDVIKGDERFFEVTKKMHNALHGVPEVLGSGDLDYFLEVNRQNIEVLAADADIHVIHDPQPIALVEDKSRRDRKWIWRCHIDFTQPQQDVWGFLARFIVNYDAAVFSAPAFSRPLPIRQVLISPSIDPLSDKNRELEEGVVGSVCERFGLDRSRALLCQISRFDYLKDPVGVIKVYRLVKKHLDCQLVLAGGGATDDPEGLKVLNEVKEAAQDDPDIHVLFLPPASDIEINALQRAATVVLQKSLREGFGLTVAEALWKAKPVVASAVGGIPLQIAHKYSGLLTHTVEGTAFWVKQLLNEPEYARRLGQNGQLHIKNNFLIMRNLRDYLLLFLSLYTDQAIIRL